MYLRRILLTSFVAISQLVYAAPAPAQNVARADGSLKLKSANADKLTFEYSTSSANGKNWIGLYHVTGGPDDEKKHEQSLRWEYVTKGSGSVEIATPVRGAGQYKAYFLANDGYKWLANPIPVEWKKDSSKEFKVMSYNLWYGGKKVNGNHNKQVSFLKESGADIIGFQEADGPNGGHDGKRLAEALGWNYHQPSSGDTAAIISRYQIVARHKKAMDRSNGVALSIAGGSKIMNFWSVHTTADEYGPYELCFNKANAADALKKETATKRNREIGDALNNAKSQIDDAANKPFIFVGDFNAPSHLDWVASTKSKHCGYEFAWPTSKKCTDMKLIDSFRVAHPDPAKDPGDTWSPIEHHNPDVNKDEPQDRIDFIYHKGGLKVVKSETKVVGKNNKDKPNHADNEWTSDHAALITTYQLE